MDAKRKLKGMLARIFSDATADESERAELRTYLASGALSSPEIQEVIADFVSTTWKITVADGVVSEVEKQRLREIVEVLGLAKGDVPEEWSRVLGGTLDTSEEWVLLRTFIDRAQAALLADFLRNQGIRVSVEGAFSAGVLPGVQDVRLMVLADRIAEAREAAEAFDGERV
ncbi:hypothetical protein AKJ09_11504 [Labilithrix luteola]|uniref:DUF2007 domain-containing protein n=1 Tax=Labilithrix luteola TaxID=1391654 RepID=A0A0K1QGE5_9BACT|nr:DUF2007 domain-containing protein [Labilithrix luteola]AKV04841.1 hypothetical protein AKJ09_11504 [Labilithrix luteola]